MIDVTHGQLLAEKMGWTWFPYFMGNDAMVPPGARSHISAIRIPPYSTDLQKVIEIEDECFYVGGKEFKKAFTKILLDRIGHTIHNALRSTAEDHSYALVETINEFNLEYDYKTEQWKTNDNQNQ